MPSKRYRLKLEHPYAKAGTIVEEDEREVPVNHPTYVTLDESFPEIIAIPDSVKADWLEEVKEEPMCSKEFAEAMERFLVLIIQGPAPVAHAVMARDWLTKHTLTEE